MSENKANIINEHLWFTLTTITVNGYIIFLEGKHGISTITLVIGSIIVSLFALYLILDRAIFYYNYNQTEGSTKKKYYYNPESILRFNPFAAMEFVFLREFSGAAFYFILVLFSCIGVILSKFNFNIFTS